MSSYSHLYKFDYCKSPCSPPDPSVEKKFKDWVLQSQSPDSEQGVNISGTEKRSLVDFYINHGVPKVRNNSACDTYLREVDGPGYLQSLVSPGTRKAIEYARREAIKSRQLNLNGQEVEDFSLEKICSLDGVCGSSGQNYLFKSDDLEIEVSIPSSGSCGTGNASDNESNPAVIYYQVTQNGFQVRLENAQQVLEKVWLKVIEMHEKVETNTINVLEVHKGSPAARAKLKRGDVIIEIEVGEYSLNRRPESSKRGFIGTLTDRPGIRKVTYLRNNKEFKVDITPKEKDGVFIMGFEHEVKEGRNLQRLPESCNVIRFKSFDGEWAQDLGWPAP